VDTTSLKNRAKATASFLQVNLKIRPKYFCLITGPPRSATTAISNWIGSQKGTVSFNETRILVTLSPFIQQLTRYRRLEQSRDLLLVKARETLYAYYSSRALLLGRRLLVDKNPLEPIAFPDRRYDDFLKSVRLLLPQAKFLFLMRDPVATIWSMTQRKWGYSLTDREPVMLPLDDHIQTWIDCAELVPAYLSDPNTYICQYGRLFTDPKAESERIFDFLKIRHGEQFRPRPGKQSAFTDDDRDQIRRRTMPVLEMLASHGISELG
jgi:hypothetical protein